MYLYQSCWIVVGTSIWFISCRHSTRYPLQVDVSGYYVLSVRTNGTHINGSPWTVFSSPAATYPPNSVMWGGGLTYAMVVATSYITIQARDVYHNNRTMNSDFIQIIFTGPSGALVKYGVDASSQNGYYTVDYTPQNSGNFSVAVLMNKQHIKGASRGTCHYS